MKMNPYLHSFTGNCAEAFDFYAKTLGGTIVFKMTFGEAPNCKDMPEETKNHIIHVRLVFGDNVLMGGDCPPGHYAKPQGLSINLGVDSIEEAERIFAALSEKGEVMCPMAETFWAVRFGMTIDRFGIPWMVNYEKKS